VTNSELRPEAILRPLMLAAVGSGVLALSLLQFSVDALPLLGADGKLLVARSIRTAFFAFLGGSAALLVAYLTASWKSERLSLAFNLYGAIAFVGGATLAGGQVGGALKILAGEQGGLPPPVALFFLFNMVAVVVLGVVAVVSAVSTRRARRAPARPMGGSQ
jgi:hypothetical protein